MQDKIVQAIEEALKGTKQLAVTFQQEAIQDLLYIWMMIISGRVQVSRDDRESLESVRKNLAWFDDESRTIVLTLTEHFDQELFISRMGRRGVLQEIAAVQ